MMKKKVLYIGGLLTGLSQQAIAADTGINPICTMVQALAQNFDIIIWLIVGILAVAVIGASVVRLIAGKPHETLILILGGAIILIGAYKMLAVMKNGANTFAQNCGSSTSINLMVSEAEIWNQKKISR